MTDAFDSYSMEGGSPNQRTAQIRKFCAQPPKGATTLRLLVPGEGYQRRNCLCQFDAAYCKDNGQVALDVDSYLTQHCETTGRAIQADLEWCRESTNPNSLDGYEKITSKVLKCRPKGEDADGASLAAMGIDGTGTGQVVQMQRHVEHLTRSYVGAHQYQVVALTEMSQQSYRELAEERAKYMVLYNEHLAILREISEWRENTPKLGEGTSTPLTDQARAEIIQTINAQVKVAFPLALQAIARHFNITK